MEGIEEINKDGITRRTFLKTGFAGIISLLFLEKCREDDRKRISGDHYYLGIPSPVVKKRERTVEEARSYFEREGFSFQEDRSLSKLVYSLIGGFFPDVKILTLFVDSKEKKRFPYLSATHVSERTVVIFLEDMRNENVLRLSSGLVPRRTLSSFLIDGVLIHELWHLYNPFSIFTDNSEKAIEALSSIGKLFKDDDSFIKICDFVVGFDRRKNQFVARGISTFYSRLAKLRGEFERLQEAEFSDFRQSQKQVMSYPEMDEARRRILDTMNMWRFLGKRTVDGDFPSREIVLLLQRTLGELIAYACENEWIDYGHLESARKELVKIAERFLFEKVDTVAQFRNAVKRSILRNQAGFYPLLNEEEVRKIISFAKS